MKRDVAVVPFDNRTELVIASDNSGAIGMKPMDEVAVPYDLVSYYGFRVAYMECVSAGAAPFSVVIYNFCGDDAWLPLMKGIEKGIRELNLEDIAITGSTETNFPLKQSAIAITVLGKRGKREEIPLCYSDEMRVAVIGKPLVGNEVIESSGDVAPLPLFQSLVAEERMLSIVPAGSKGILYELKELFGNNVLQFDCSLDLKKSAGPSSCFIAVYNEMADEMVRLLAGHLFHPVHVIK